ncbi:MAG: hypothetical protein E4H47_00210 [Parcubacteria group bacterium]|nr:MAG: hypothetical protein E4H47_00210 [Parcubacteria group bacterium]
MMKKSFLSDQCREVILGSLLGDGSLKIHSSYINARFSFRHSTHQKEYFFWKAEKLKEISGNSSFWQQKADGFGGEKLRYQSLALESLTDLYQLVSKNNNLEIRRKWLNKLTPLSLMIWWLDDGSLIGNGKRGVFCTDSFSLEEQKLLVRYLYKVWGVKVSIGKIHRERNGKAKEYYRLWIRSSEELKKFLRIILPYMSMPTMLPKVLILYKDSELQQRWISEVSHLSKIPMDIVEKYLLEKKMKYKSFRK